MDANCESQKRYARECFNPRARDGRENPNSGVDAAIIVSIHAPVMDAK